HLSRQLVHWPDFEADAVVRPEVQTNPVDLGAILVPHDWLVVRRGEKVTIATVAFAARRSVPHARLQVWFDGEHIVEAPLGLERGRRFAKDLRVATESN